MNTKEFSKEEVIEFLHDAVNDSHCSPKRIKHPNSNNCAEFVNQFGKENGLMKQSFEVGEYYELNEAENCFGQYTGINTGTGLKDDGDWSTNLFMSEISLWTKLTPDQVKEALIKDGVKKYKTNDTLAYFKGNEKEQVISNMNEFIYCNDEDSLMIKGGCKSGAGLVIYRKGIWATIIPNKEEKADKMLELAKMLGEATELVKELNALKN